MEGISRYEISANRFSQVYNSPSSEKNPALFVGEDNNIIYFYSESGTITGIDSHTFKVICETKTGLPAFADNTKLSDNIINHKVALIVNSTLYLWDLEKRKLLYQSTPIANISLFFLRMKTENEVLYCNNVTNVSLELYNFTNNTKSAVFVKQKSEVLPFRSNMYSWQNKILLSYYNNLYETDANFKIKSELVNFQNKPIAGNTSVAHIKEDNFGNLYLVTISDGFRKIIRNNYPIKYYGTEKKEYNYVLSILPDKKNNKILAGTYGSGLLVFDTLQRLVKHIKTLPGKSNSFSANTIIKNNKGDYILFISGEKNVWKLSNDFSQMSPIEISTSLPAHESGIGYFANSLYQNEDEAVIQSQGRLYKTNFNGNNVTEYEVTKSYTMSGLWYTNSIITHTADELIFLDAPTFKELNRIPFKNTGGVRCFAKDAANNIYAGSNKGIFKINSAGKILLHLNKEKGLPDECIYAMVFDKEGYLWCSTNKGVFKVNKDNSILQLTKEDGLQENEFNTNVAAKTDDGEIFFGGVNGISSFFPGDINSAKEKINLLITGIKVNNKEIVSDTAIWDINQISLPYHQNSFAFDFIAMANNNPGQYIYQYRMKGIDEQWIQNDGLQTVRYFLPPGTYVFQVYASRFFNRDAKPMKEISIIIHPPFWKTWWFLTALAALLIASIAYTINQYNRRKYKKKLAELESEHKLQLERERISRDLHDNLGAYASAIANNADKALKDPGDTASLLNLKENASEIMNNLRDTIWALNKNDISITRLSDRIKTYLQKMRDAYPQTKIEMSEDIDTEVTLSPEFALNILRIVQEAFHNALRHSNGDTITITLNIGKRLYLCVKDNGTGISDVAKNNQGNGFGNMKARAKENNMKLQITSLEKEGTSIELFSQLQ
ncbi:MAG: two-component regulator propeller domain-containing protein [Segetibacter sp.]